MNDTRGRSHCLVIHQVAAVREAIQGNAAMNSIIGALFVTPR
jgi:hypothetical protein